MVGGIALYAVFVHVTFSVLALAVEDFLWDKQKNVLLIDRSIPLGGVYVCVCARARACVLIACSVPGPEATGPS